MLTRSSIQFLFDSCLISVQFPSIPTCFLFISLQFSIPSAIFFPKHPFSSPKCPFPLPFSANPLFPLPDKFPLYNIIMCPFSSPAFSFPIINYQNLPLPQPFTFLFKIFSKKSPFIFVSYHIIPYFCIRFPRDGQHLILTCCNGVGFALKNNKNNFLFIWIIIIKVVIFAVRFAE
ncbi:putative transmembrane protein, partial [Bacteroides fragilis str. 20793-3]